LGNEGNGSSATWEASGGNPGGAIILYGTYDYGEEANTSGYMTINNVQINNELSFDAISFNPTPGDSIEIYVDDIYLTAVAPSDSYANYQITIPTGIHSIKLRGVAEDANVAIDNVAFGD